MVRVVVRSVRLAILVAVGAALLLLPTGTAFAAKTAAAPTPTWFTSKIADRIDAAGTEGVPLARIREWVARDAGPNKKAQTVTDPCPGVEPYPTPAVTAGACQVAPHGCTANFIYHRGDEPFIPISDGRHHFIGTAGHCVDHANQPVYMQIFTGVIAKVGEVEKILGGGRGEGVGGFGNDFAVIEIDPGFKVDPRSPAGGPDGIYTGCQPQAVKYWGHGFGVAVGQGRVEGGLATSWFEREFAWTGVGFPGDSGSGVTLANSEQAAGNLTHLVVDPRRYPGSDLLGTRVTRALTWLGGPWFLVNENGTYSRATMADTDCEPAQ